MKENCCEATCHRGNDVDTVGIDSIKVSERVTVIQVQGLMTPWQGKISQGKKKSGKNQRDG